MFILVSLKNPSTIVRFKVLSAAGMKSRAFWDTAPSTPKRIHGAVSQTTLIFHPPFSVINIA
jgi:hypothetical protein